MLSVIFLLKSEYMTNFFFVMLPSPDRRKMQKKQGRVFFFFFFLCQIWAKNLLKFLFNGIKKHLYMRFDCIPARVFPI